MQIKYNMCGVKKASVKCKELVNPVVAMGITYFFYIDHMSEQYGRAPSCLNRSDKGAQCLRYVLAGKLETYSKAL